MKPTVLLDCDGVLADFVSAALRIVKSLTGRYYSPETITTWEVFDSLPEDERVRSEVYRAMKAPGGCSNIPVYADALSGVKRLREIADVVAVTSPFKGSLTWAHEREVWLEKYFGISNVIHARDKRRVHGDFFVDDKPEHIREWLAYWATRDPNCVGILWQTPRVDQLPHGVSTWDQVIEIVSLARGITPAR